MDDRFYLNSIKVTVQSGILNHLSNARLVDYSSLLAIKKNKLMFDMSDISLETYLGVSGKWIISPVLFKSRNHGFDGSGVYCQNVNLNEINNSNPSLMNIQNNL